MDICCLQLQSASKMVYSRITKAFPQSCVLVNDSQLIVNSCLEILPSLMFHMALEAFVK